MAQHNDPLSGARYPDDNEPPSIAQFIQNAVNDLSGQVIPRFATTSARDTAYSNWVAAGHTIVNGMTCWCDTPGRFFDRIGGAWVQRPLRSWGLVGASSDSGGAVNFNHGLGATPTAVLLTATSSAIQGQVKYVVTAVTSVAIQVVGYDSSGSVYASNPFSFYWEALA